MHYSTKKWIFTKICSLILIPFMIWFLMNIVTIFNGNYDEVVNFFTSQPSKILFSIFIVSMFFYSALSISEIFEDYIKQENAKKYANFVTKRSGGDRAVAEACIHILKKFFKAYNPNKLPINKGRMSGKWSV